LAQTENQIFKDVPDYTSVIYTCKVYARQWHSVQSLIIQNHISTTIVTNQLEVISYNQFYMLRVFLSYYVTLPQGYNTAFHSSSITLDTDSTQWLSHLMNTYKL